MGFALVLMTGLFMYDNADFFATAKQNKEDGMSWQYVGKQSPGDNPAITVKDADDNNVVYFKMEHAFQDELDK